MVQLDKKVFYKGNLIILQFPNCSSLLRKKRVTPHKSDSTEKIRDVSLGQGYKHSTGYLILFQQKTTLVIIEWI